MSELPAIILYIFIIVMNVSIGMIMISLLHSDINNRCGECSCGEILVAVMYPLVCAQSESNS